MAEEEKEAMNIGRYFDPAVRTVFDELISTNRLDGEIPKTVQSRAAISTSRKEDSEEEDNENEGSNDSSNMWIASENTRKILRSIATSGPLEERERLTMPGLTIRSELVDATREMAVRYLGEEEAALRKVMGVSDVTQDERGLRELIEAGCYKAAVNLTGRLISVYGQGYGKMNNPSKHTPHSLQLWYTRLALLAKLRKTDVLKAESQPFENLDKPDIYFTFYPELYGTRAGSMASFAFRLLLAEIPAQWGKPRQAIDNLYEMLSIVEKIIGNLGSASDPVSAGPALRLWGTRRRRIFISIVNCALAMKNFVLAIDTLEELETTGEWSREEAKILRSAIGRVHLLIGDVATAETKFVLEEKAVLGLRELIDRGLMAVAQNSFREALNCFQRASEMDPSDPMLVNNMAVCLLYTGELKSAIQLLEQALARDPAKSLQEPLLLNMRTLYELHTTHCKQSKLHLLKQLARYKGDAVDPQCLQLS